MARKISGPGTGCQGTRPGARSATPIHGNSSEARDIAAGAPWIRPDHPTRVPPRRLQKYGTYVFAFPAAVADNAGMEAFALHPSHGLATSPRILRLAGDERLVALIRAGN